MCGGVSCSRWTGNVYALMLDIRLPDIRGSWPKAADGAWHS
eukprot:CAMPEP_0181243314 /NCGR_PEP_ID=MMETSP1096-20121128/42199_1 /TAXON_ID=156174 ORGANISM="Chrysochromulina ericina, Strain CCMP281" /NCGR_SAMPLE_ID=MMETSP1096 /ASSEMBLY_ACC=CAM_ASM_000453 /LENGTH=40 /DNA_ID= /DNA_START= /DNA_END= /DNA_ORIENTATION=